MTGCFRAQTSWWHWLRLARRGPFPHWGLLNAVRMCVSSAIPCVVPAGEMEPSSLGLSVGLGGGQGATHHQKGHPEAQVQTQSISISPGRTSIVLPRFLEDFSLWICFCHARQQASDSQLDSSSFSLSVLYFINLYRDHFTTSLL